MLPKPGPSLRVSPELVPLVPDRGGQWHAAVVLFVGRPGATVGIAALWQEVTRISEPCPLPLLPDPQRTQLPPSAVARAAARRGRTLKIAAYGAIAIAVLTTIALAPRTLCIW